MRTLLLAALAAFALSSAQAFNYSTGFESSDGWSIGSVDGQNGFTTFTAAQNAPVISDINPYAGLQHVRLWDDPNASDGTLNGIFTPDFVGSLDGSETMFTTSLELSISSATGSYQVAGQDPTAGFLSWRVVFDAASGDVFILDDIGAGLEFVDSGFAYTPGGYHNFSVVHDKTANTVDYLYDGSSIYTGGSVVDDVNTSQVVMFSDSYQSANEFADIDNFSLDAQAVPEPTTMVLLGLGIAGLAARRRKA